MYAWFASPKNPLNHSWFSLLMAANSSPLSSRMSLQVAGAGVPAGTGRVRPEVTGVSYGVAGGGGTRVRGYALRWSAPGAGVFGAPVRGGGGPATIGGGSYGAAPAVFVRRNDVVPVRLYHPRRAPAGLMLN